jgi:hypothetical protein
MRIALGVVVVAASTGALAPSVSAAPKLPAADRAAIDRTLDVFVPAAIGRVRSERAWAVTTAAMHRGGTLADWRQGVLPVQPFPVIGKTFHGWTLDGVGRDRADVVLLVHLRKGNDLGIGAVSFDIPMRKVNGRWLVDSVVAAATFAATGTPSKILAGNDYGPNSSSDPYTKVKGGLHSGLPTGLIYAIPGVLLGLVVLVPLGILLLHRRRDRVPVSEARRERVFRTSGEGRG